MSQTKRSCHRPKEKCLSKIKMLPWIHLLTSACWSFFLAWAAITKCHNFSGLNNHCFSQFWRLASPQSKCWPGLFLVRTLFSAGGHLLSTCVLWWLFLGVCSSYMDSDLTMRVPPVWLHLNLIIFQSPPPNNIRSGIRASPYEFWEGYSHSVH